jgi:hypothetical protein
MVHLRHFSSMLLFHRVRFLLNNNRKLVWLPPSSSQLGNNPL